MIWQGENRTKDEKEDKRGQKDEKLTKRWWNDDAWLNIDNYSCSASMDNPTCNTAITMIGCCLEGMDFWHVLPTVHYTICHSKTAQVE